MKFSGCLGLPTRELSAVLVSVKQMFCISIRDANPPIPEFLKRHVFLSHPLNDSPGDRAMAYHESSISNENEPKHGHPLLQHAHQYRCIVANPFVTGYASSSWDVLDTILRKWTSCMDYSEQHTKDGFKATISEVSQPVLPTDPDGRKSQKLSSKHKNLNHNTEENIHCLKQHKTQENRQLPSTFSLSQKKSSTKKHNPPVQSKRVSPKKRFGRQHAKFCKKSKASKLSAESLTAIATSILQSHRQEIPRPESNETEEEHSQEISSRAKKPANLTLSGQTSISSSNFQCNGPIQVELLKCQSFPYQDDCCTPTCDNYLGYTNPLAVENMGLSFVPNLQEDGSRVTSTLDSAQSENNFHKHTSNTGQSQERPQNGTDTDDDLELLEKMLE